MLGRGYGVDKWGRAFVFTHGKAFKFYHASLQLTQKVYPPKQINKQTWDESPATFLPRVMNCISWFASLCWHVSLIIHFTLLRGVIRAEDLKFRNKKSLFCSANSFISVKENRNKIVAKCEAASIISYLALPVHSLHIY